MLVLTRKQQEKIQIGDDIVITVLRTKGKTVRLGIEAPSTVPVLRGELAVRIREETEEAAKPDAPVVTESPKAPESVDSTPGADVRWESNAANEPQVMLERVPRSRVATVLPQMLGAATFADSTSTGGGPLRAMLDRRAGSAL